AVSAETPFLAGRIRLYLRSSHGFVAHVAQEVVKEQWTLSVGGFGGQGVAQFGCSAALVSLLTHQLSFPDHGHAFDTDERGLRRVKRFASEHRTRHALDSSLVLLHDLVEEFHQPDAD